jgi:exosortase B
MSAVLNSPSSPRAAVLEWLPVLAGLLALYGPTFYELANTIWQEDEHAHGPIILVVVIWLIWDRRKELLVAPTFTAHGPGLVLLLVGLLCYVAGRAVDISILEIGALVPILAGVILAMRGWATLRAMWFILLFVAYLVPLPGIFVDEVTGPLKNSVSAIAEQILYVAGYPVARSGVVITVGQYQLLVADACSGLNSMFSMSAIGLLYLYLMHHRSWLHNGLIVASLLPIAFCANIVRVIFLALVTYHFGDAAGQGFLHGFSGMVLFVVALIIIIAIDAVLTRLIRSR